MYLIPNKTFSKKGIAGGRLESKDKYLKISDSDLKVMEKNIPNLKVQGILVDSIPELVEGDPKEAGKSDARLALEKEASEFGIEFTDRTSAKDLKAEIEAKKLDSEKENMTFDDLKEQALELEIDFDDDVSVEDLALLVEDKSK